MARGRPGFPTAFPHFLLIECWPILLTPYLFNKLVTDVNVKIEMHVHEMNVSKFYKYCRSKFMLARAQKVDIPLKSVHLEEVTPSTLPGTQMVWVAMAWIFYLAAIALELGVIVAFFRPGRRFWSFNEGAYLHFTWHLPRQAWYRRYVMVMAFAAIILPLVWIVQAWIYDRDDRDDRDDREGERWGGERFWVNVRVFSEEWFTGLSMLFSLVKLGAFRLKLVACLSPSLGLQEGVRYWWVRDASDHVKERSFRRPGWLLDSFMEHNAGFGGKILDALWAAEHEDLTKLMACLESQNAEEAREFLEQCQAAQRAEGLERLEKQRQQMHEQEMSDLAAGGTGHAMTA